MYIRCIPYTYRYLCICIYMYIRCIHGIFGREITKYTVLYGVYIRFWSTLSTAGTIRGTYLHTAQRQVAVSAAPLPRSHPTSWRKGCQGNVLVHGTVRIVCVLCVCVLVCEKERGREREKECVQKCAWALNFIVPW